MEVNFVFYNKNGKKLSGYLDESIKVIKDPAEAKSINIIISNTDLVKPVIWAKEIDFYLNNSEDDVKTKAENVLKLFKIQYIRYLFATDIIKTKDISNTLLVIGTDDELTQIESIEDKDLFNIKFAHPDEIEAITGVIGEFIVVFNNKTTAKFDQILWFSAEEDAIKAGVIDPYREGVAYAWAKVHNNLMNGYEYKKILAYDTDICLYHEKKSDVCGICADICPEEAITKDKENKHLIINDIKCSGCGGCVSICPAGALDFTETGRGAFYKMSKLFMDHIALIIPEPVGLDELRDVTLKKGVLPFIIGGRKFLDEAHFITLIQESSHQVILYNNELSKGTEDAINIINQIFRSKYKKDGVLVATDKDELKEAISAAEKIDGSFFDIPNELFMTKREIFTKRLKFIVGEEDLGTIKTGKYVKYAEVKVDQTKCTLCLSCAGGCSVNALYPNKSDNSLRFKPYLCADCGYCKEVCPEDCITIIEGEIQLNPSFFEEKILAKDELFRCIECGKPFAPSKSIKKVAELFISIFGEDDPRVKTLYCCPDCKPKVMLKMQIEERKKYELKH